MNKCTICKRMELDAKKMNIQIDFACECHTIKKPKKVTNDSSIITGEEKIK